MRYRLIAIVLVLCLTAIVLLGYNLQEGIIDSFTAAFNRQGDLLVAAKANKISEYLRSRVACIKQLSLLVHADTPRPDEIFLQLCHASDGQENSQRQLFIYDLNGELTTSPTGSVAPDDSYAALLTETLRHHENGEITATSPVRFFAPNPADPHGYWLVAPMYDRRHNQAGWLAGRYSLENAVARIIASFDFGKIGYAWLIDNAGTIIYHSAAPELAGRQAAEVAGENGTHSLLEMVKTMSAGRSGHGRYTLRGITREVSYAPVMLPDGGSWSLAFFIPARESAVPGQNMLRLLRNIFLLSTISVLVFSAIIIKLNRQREHAWARSQYADDLQREVRLRTDELNHALANLREVDQIKDEFLASVTHELRSPLVSVQGYAEMMAEARLGPLTEKQEKGLTIVLRNLQRVLRLVDNILDFSRQQTRQMPINPQPFLLGKMIDERLLSFKPQVTDAGIELVWQRPSALLLVDGDKELLGQVIFNLVGNALQYTPQGGKITVSVAATEEKAEIKISDTGCGISAEDLKRIPEPFFRAKTNKEIHKPGTGLGLMIVKHILEVHKSYLRIKSEVGKGTTVSFTLRRAQAVAKE